MDDVVPIDTLVAVGGVVGLLSAAGVVEALLPVPLECRAAEDAHAAPERTGGSAPVTAP